MAVSGVLALAGCSLIDDDLSDCGNDYQLDYELQLVTNLTTELQTSLTTQTDISVASSLRTYLGEVFTDFAHDVDLSFYDTHGDSLRLQHDKHIMDANQASYTLFLPMRQYMHLAVANVLDNPQVTIASDERCHTAQLLQVAPTLGWARETRAGSISASHTTGLFTARLPMEVLEGIDQHFDVHLYMVNCSAVLVLDTVGAHASDYSVLTTGFATGFNIADSTYIFEEPSPLILADTVTTGADGLLTFCTVNFPSREPPQTRLIIETVDPFIAPTAEESLWQYIVYVTLPDGTVTRSDIYINSPLRAGQLRVVKARVLNDGGVRPTDQTIGVSITTNWNQGGQHNPVL